MYNTVHKIRVNYTTKFRDLKIPLGMEENLPVLEDIFAIFTSHLRLQRTDTFSIIPQLAPYKSALPLDVKPKCSLLVGPFSLVS